MKDKARIGNHPIHPMLIPFPIGLWIFSLFADIIYGATGNPAWAMVAYYSMAGGIVGAVVAAIPGLIDYFDMSPSRTKTIATRHMILNFAALVVFIWSLSIREPAAPIGTSPVILSVIGVAILLVSGWYGGSMVYVHGMAVDETEVCTHGERVSAHGLRR